MKANKLTISHRLYGLNAYKETFFNNSIIENNSNDCLNFVGDN